MQSTAGFERAKREKWTKGMPPHKGLNPSAPKLKGHDVAAEKRRSSSHQKFPTAGRNRRIILEKRRTAAVARKREAYKDFSTFCI